MTVAAAVTVAAAAAAAIFDDLPPAPTISHDSLSRRLPTATRRGGSTREALPARLPNAAALPTSLPGPTGGN